MSAGSTGSDTNTIGVAMKVKSSLALIALAGLAALWYFKGDAWGPAIGIRPAHTEPPKSPAASTLEALTPAAISRIEIAFGSGETINLERADTESGWKLPGNWPLRKPEVEELVETLGTLHTRFQSIPLGDNSSLSQFGLAPDQKPLTVKITSKTQLLTLTFGEPALSAGETVFSRPSYVRVNDAPEVLKLGPDVLPVVRRSADAYRRRTLFPDIERVKFAGSAGPGIPIGAPPAGEAPSMVALPGEDTLAIRVERTVPKLWNINLTPALGFTLVRTGKLPEPAIFTKGGEPVVQPDRLADAWALDAPVRVRAEPERLRGVLAAVADLWADSFAGNDAIDIRIAAARFFPLPLDQLAGAIRFVPLSLDARTGLDQPTGSVTVRRKSGEPVTIRLGGIAKAIERDETIMVPGGPPGTPPRPMTNKVQSAYRFARVDGNPQLFVVSADKLADLFVSASTLADPEVARFARDEVRQIAIKPNGKPEIRLALTKGNSKSTKVEEQQDRWFIQAMPNPILADTASVNDLLDRLSTFRATGTNETFESGNAPPDELRIAVTTHDARPEGESEGPARAITLLVGKPDYSKQQLPIQRDGWPRLIHVGNTLTNTDTGSWVTGLLFPNTVLDLLERPALAYRNRKLFDAAAELTAVTASGRFALRRDSEEWKLTAPIRSDADANKAGQLAGSLAGLAATDYLTAMPTAGELKAFGLDPPAQSVQLEFRDGRSYTLDLGSGRPGKPEVFARLDRGAVFALSSSVLDQLTTGVVDLLPLKVWNVAPEKITRVEIAQTGEMRSRFQLTKTGSDWTLTGPFTATIPAANARPLVTTIGGLMAVKYQSLSSANAAEYGFEKPRLTITLAYTEPRPSAGGEAPVTTRVVIGGPSLDGSGRFARLDIPSAPVFILPNAFVAAAETPPLELLNKTLVSLDSNAIRKIAVTGPKQEDALSLVRDSAGKWSVEGIAFAVDAERIAQLTRTAAHLPVSRIAAYGETVIWAEYGLDHPQTIMHVTSGPVNAERQTTIALGNIDPSGARFARVDGGKAVAAIPPSAADTLARKKFEYADRTLLSFDPTTLVGISRKQGKEELELAPAAAIGWDIVKPSKQKADQPFVDDLAETLSRLRADRVAAYGPKGAMFKQFGLESPVATITVTIGDKAEEKSLRIGERVKSGMPSHDRFASVESSKADVIVGVLPGALAEKLLAPAVSFRDRTLARFVDAEKVVVVRGDRTITFSKVGVTWKVTEPLATDAESAELEALVSDLGKLRAESWVAEKSAESLKSFGLAKPELKWTISNRDQIVLELLLGTRTPDGRMHVTTNKGDLVGLLDPQSTSRLNAEYRQRKPWELDAAQATEIEITAGKSFMLEKSGATWTDPAKPNDMIDEQVVGDLLGTLSALRVERYVVDKNADRKLFGLEKPEYLLTVMSAGTRHTLEIGGVVGGTDGKERYACVTDKNRSDVFVLSAADTARFTHDRTAFVKKK